MSKQSPSTGKTADGDAATRREFLANLAVTAASTAILGTTAQALADPVADEAEDQAWGGRLRRPRRLARRSVPKTRRL